MGLNLNSFFKEKTVKLSDSYLVYIKNGEDLTNTFECIGFTLPKYSFKEETISYGNNTQSFFLPNYQALDTVSFDVLLYKHSSSNVLLSLINSFKKDTSSQDYGYFSPKSDSNTFFKGYIKNNLNNYAQLLSQVNIYVLNNNLNKVVYEYEFKDLTLVDYNLYELSYQSDSPCQVSLTFAFEVYNKYSFVDFINADLDKFERAEEIVKTYKSEMEKLTSSYNTKVQKMGYTTNRINEKERAAIDEALKTEIPNYDYNELTKGMAENVSALEKEKAAKINTALTQDTYESFKNILKLNETYKIIDDSQLGNLFASFNGEGKIKNSNAFDDIKLEKLSTVQKMKILTILSDVDGKMKSSSDYIDAVLSQTEDENVKYSINNYLLNGVMDENLVPMLKNLENGKELEQEIMKAKMYDLYFSDLNIDKIQAAINADEAVKQPKFELEHANVDLAGFNQALTDNKFWLKENAENEIFESVKLDYEYFVIGNAKGNHANYNDETQQDVWERVYEKGFQISDNEKKQIKDKLKEWGIEIKNDKSTAKSRKESNLTWEEIEGIIKQQNGFIDKQTFETLAKIKQVQNKKTDDMSKLNHGQIYYEDLTKEQIDSVLKESLYGKAMKTEFDEQDKKSQGADLINFRHGQALGKIIEARKNQLETTAKLSPPKDEDE